MIVAQIIETVLTRVIPVSAPALVEGQCISRVNLPVVNSTVGTILGVLQHDMPAVIVGEQTNGILYNLPRATALAVQGKLAIRTLNAAAFTAIAVGGPFNIVNGFAAPTTAGFTNATTLGGNALVVDEKVTGADGVGYVMVLVY